MLVDAEWTDRQNKRLLLIDFNIAMAVNDAGQRSGRQWQVVPRARVRAQHPLTDGHWSGHCAVPLRVHVIQAFSLLREVVIDNILVSPV